MAKNLYIVLKGEFEIIRTSLQIQQLVKDMEKKKSPAVKGPRSLSARKQVTSGVGKVKTRKSSIDKEQIKDVSKVIMSLNHDRSIKRRDEILVKKNESKDQIRQKFFRKPLKLANYSIAKVGKDQIFGIPESIFRHPWTFSLTCSSMEDGFLLAIPIENLRTLMDNHDFIKEDLITVAQ